MTGLEGALLVGGGLLAGTVNTMAGGGSALTVPLLVIAGVPGNVANGSNRVGILTASASAVATFRKAGVGGLAAAMPVLAPVLVGSLVGSTLVGGLADGTFEKVFGWLMIPVIVLTVLKPTVSADRSPWPRWVTVSVFLIIGIYGGAFQAGVGLILLTALVYAGFDLVTANSIKVMINLAVTVMALPVFVAQGNVAWGPAFTLGVGFACGGWVGARVAVRGGEKVVRVVMVIGACILSGKLLGLY